MELVKYKEIGELEVDVEVEAFLRVLSITLLEGPKWVETSAFGRSDIFCQWMSTVVPTHIVLAFDQPFCYKILVDGEVKRGRQRKNPSLFIGLNGYCAAQSDECESTFAAGFTCKSLNLLLVEQDDLPPLIPLTITFAPEKSCTHVNGKMYGSLKGLSRKVIIDKFNVAGKPPAEFAKDQLANANDKSYHASNRGTQLTRESTYNISREARAKQLKDSGFTLQNNNLTLYNRV